MSEPEKCDLCQGKGSWPHEERLDHIMICNLCAGTGYKSSLLSAELFDEIIDFLKKVSDSSSECISSLEAEDLIVRLQEWKAHE
jgi:excinuclease UvrABC ATPase subunit